MFVILLEIPFVSVAIVRPMHQQDIRVNDWFVSMVDSASAILSGSFRDAKLDQTVPTVNIQLYGKITIKNIHFLSCNLTSKS